MGFTVVVTYFEVWLAKFHDNVKCLNLSQGEDEAFDLLDKCIYLDDNLPPFLKGSLRSPDQKGHIGFPDADSEIRALPSTEKAGRSTDATLVFCDEWEYHPYAEKNFAAVKPTIDGGGLFIGGSTFDPTRKDTFFKEKYFAAKAGEGQFKKGFLPFDVRPGRDDAWRDRASADLKVWQKLSEYPRTEAEALSIIDSLKFLDKNALDDLQSRQILPLPNHDLYGKHKTVKIYKLPVTAGKYMVICDPSDGKEDPHAIIVVDATTMEEVASSHGKVPADRCAVIFDDLVRLYNNAFNLHELNARAGGIFSQKLKDLNTPNQCHFLKPDKKLDPKKIGWWTGATLKEWVYDLLEEAVRNRAIQPHDPKAIGEMKDLNLLEGEAIPEVPRGGHDDWCDVWARAVALKRYMRFGEISIRSIPYKV